MRDKEAISSSHPLELEGPREPQIFFNLSSEKLTEHTVARGEGVQIQYEDENGVLQDGALSIVTNMRKRSTEDIYYVKHPDGPTLWEKVNKPMSPDYFAGLKSDALTHLEQGDRYVMDVAVGVDVPGTKGIHSARTKYRVITNSPSHAMFVGIMFDKLTPDEQAEAAKEDYQPDMTVIHAPDFHTDPTRHGTTVVINESDGSVISDGTIALVTDYEDKTTVMVGIDYNGHGKKDKLKDAVEFAAQNNEHIEALMQAMGVELDEIFDTDDVWHGASFVMVNGKLVVVKGGSGAGKSSSMPEPDIEAGERMDADDEIKVNMIVLPLYTAEGKTEILPGDIVVGDKIIRTILHNAERGGYLTSKNFNDIREKRFKDAAQKKGSMLENGVVNPKTRKVDFADDSLTPNARAVVPLSKMKGYVENRLNGPVSDVVLVVPDLRGVLHPLAQTDEDDPIHALFWDYIGVGADKADRASGLKEDRESFVPYYMNPFSTREPESFLYARYRIYKANKIRVTIGNSGFRKGKKGEGGVRPPVESTQAIVDAVARNRLEDANWSYDPVFKLKYLKREGNEHLDPSLWEEDNTWPDPMEKKRQIVKLVNLIREEFYRRKAETPHPLHDAMEKWLPEIPPGYLDETVFDAAEHPEAA